MIALPNYIGILPTSIELWRWNYFWLVWNFSYKKYEKDHNGLFLNIKWSKKLRDQRIIHFVCARFPGISNHMFLTHFEPFNFKSIENSSIERCSSQSISLERLAIIYLVHMLARKCTRRMLASNLREIGWLEQYTIPMISKHLKISLTSKVYYYMVSSVAHRLNLPNLPIFIICIILYIVSYHIFSL